MTNVEARMTNQARSSKDEVSPLGHLGIDWPSGIFLVLQPLIRVLD